MRLDLAPDLTKHLAPLRFDFASGTRTAIGGGNLVDAVEALAQAAAGHRLARHTMKRLMAGESSSLSPERRRSCLGQVPVG